MMFYDAVTTAVSYFLALFIRFDFHFNEIKPSYISIYYETILLYVLFCLCVYWLLKLYRSIWRFASYTELIRVLTAVTFCAAFHFVYLRLFIFRMPNSYIVIGYLLQMIFAIAIRFSYRFILLIKNRKPDNSKRVMLIGAGDAGLQLLREINKSDKTSSKVVCIIDDNTNKHGRYIEGIPVVGGRDDILANVSKYAVDQIY